MGKNKVEKLNEQCAEVIKNLGIYASTTRYNIELLGKKGFLGIFKQSPADKSKIVYNLDVQSGTILATVGYNGIVCTRIRTDAKAEEHNDKNAPRDCDVCEVQKIIGELRNEINEAVDLRKN